MPLKPRSKCGAFLAEKKCVKSGNCGSSFFKSTNFDGLAYPIKIFGGVCHHPISILEQGGVTASASLDSWRVINSEVQMAVKFGVDVPIVDVIGITIVSQIVAGVGCRRVVIKDLSKAPDLPPVSG